jgi:hypothetical protein
MGGGMEFKLGMIVEINKVSGGLSREKERKQQIFYTPPIITDKRISPPPQFLQ